MHQPIRLIILIICLYAGSLFSHTDLELQIEALNEQMELEGPQAELVLKRGNLYRRHEDWEMAARDFAAVRELDPANAEVDWIEGLYLSDTDQWQAADEMLTRFIQSNRGYAPAFHVRGGVRWKLGKHEAAASDYQSAINLSEHPSPSLFRSHIIAELSAGPDGLAAAEASAQAGLNQFPREIALLGLATDIALVRSDSQGALGIMMRVPPRIQDLLQWKFRKATWMCISGQTETARETLEDMLAPGDEIDRRRAGTFDLSPDEVRQLAANLGPDICRAAVSQLLAKLEP